MLKATKPRNDFDKNRGRSQRISCRWKTSAQKQTIREAPANRNWLNRLILFKEVGKFPFAGASLIVCFWAEVFHLQDCRWDRPQFLSKSSLGTTLTKIEADPNGSLAGGTPLPRNRQSGMHLLIKIFQL